MIKDYMQKLKEIVNNVEYIEVNNKLIATDFSLQESITSIKRKVNEVVDAINDGRLKGEKGDTGEKGDAGEKGEKGDKGEQGLQGYRGEKGDKGDRGEKGDKGDRGEKGEIGLKGDKGDKGDKGEDGLDGINGLDGENVELRRTNTHIQWKLESETEWKDLIEIDELRAPALLSGNCYTKEETDELIAQKITEALQQIGVTYATKEELSEAIASIEIPEAGLSVVGKLGAGAKLVEAPLSIRNFEITEAGLERFGTPKHSMMIGFPGNSTSTNLIYYKYFFFTDLNDTSDGKYVYIDSGGRIRMDKLKINEDYTYYKTTSATEPPADYSTSNTSYVYTNYLATRTYMFDFNIYNDGASQVLYSSTVEGGITDLNTIEKDGYYIIDETVENYSNMSYIPKLTKPVDKVKGYLTNINNTQVFDIANVGTYIRENKKEWQYTGAKDIVGKIGISKGIKTPDLFKNAPADNWYLYPTKRQCIMFRRNETEYWRILFPVTTAHLLYVSGSYICPASTSTTMQVDKYDSTTNTWSQSTSIASKTSIDLNYFTIYHTDFAVRTTSSSSSDIYQDVTVANYDIEETITDFNNAVETGKYHVLKELVDDIANSPVDYAKGILTVEKLDDDIMQIVDLNDGSRYTRAVDGLEWEDWTAHSKRFDSYEYTNADGMPELYEWTENAGIKTMFIEVKLSDAEYNMGSNGLLMKTLNIPVEAQIFDKIRIGTITSYCREGNITLSRIVQNVEVIDNKTVRARWRNTDNTYPKIDRFVMMLTGE